MSSFRCARFLQIGVAVSGDWLIVCLPGLPFRTGLPTSLIIRSRLDLRLARTSLRGDWISDVERRAGWEVEKHLNERPFSSRTVDAEQCAHVFDLGLVQVTEQRFGSGDMTLGYAFTHAGNAAAVCAAQFEIIHDTLQHIPIHHLEDCVFKSHWIALFVFDVDALQVNSTE